MLVVCLASLDFAFGKLVWAARPEPVIFALPMINVLVLAVPKLRGERRSYWVGFQIAGCVLAAMLVFLIEFELILFPMQLVENFLASMRLKRIVYQSVGLPCALVIYTAPLVLLSMLGGSIAARWLEQESRPGAA